MVFRARARFDDKKPPARAYLYTSPLAPFDATYGKLEDAVRYIDNELVSHKKILGKADFLIPFVWGCKGEKVIEVFGLCNSLEDWPKSNLELFSWVFVNGKQKPRRRNIGCGESAIVLGKELEYRSQTKTFKEYVESPPNLAAIIDKPLYDLEVTGKRFGSVLDYKDFQTKRVDILHRRPFSGLDAPKQEPRPSKA